MSRNERTSPRVARIAAKVMAERCGGDVIVAWLATHGTGVRNTPLYWRDIRALAASCLTQTAAKPAHKPTTGRVTIKGKTPGQDYGRQRVLRRGP